MSESTPGQDQSTKSLRWNVRLSDKDPKKVVVIVLSALTAGVAGYVLVGQVLLGVLGVAMVLGATAEFWLGTSFSVGPNGASRRVGASVTSIEWSDVKRVMVLEDEVKLSPLESESRLDPFRGVILRTTPLNRESVLELVQHYVGHDV